jgi:hypothetical protein
MSNNRKTLLASIASVIADYREGEIDTPDSAHVDAWISQFDAAVQESILSELHHVLKKTYITKTEVEKFLSNLATAAKLVGAAPHDFWKSANFLNIQGGGNSQSELLQMFDLVLQKTCGLGIDECGSNDGPYIYLDDVVFTGNRVKNDLIKWLKSSAPAKAKVHVIVIAFHRGGQYYAKTKIAEACAAEKKSLDITWWRRLEMEDRKTYVNNSDVLRPSSFPSDALTQAYVKGLKYAPLIRRGTNIGENKFFTSNAGRCILEQEFLKAGVHIRSICPYLNVYQRPLGNMVLESLGFGALVVTFRNCPNNAPLALWAGDPWYPLFPRKTN